MVRKIALKRIEIEQLRDCLSSGKFHDGDKELDVPWTFRGLCMMIGTARA
jgi:hypothetical protein